MSTPPEWCQYTREDGETINPKQATTYLNISDLILFSLRATHIEAVSSTSSCKPFTSDRS